MLKKGWILFDIIANLVLLTIIVIISLLLLHKIKLKLNFTTKSVFYLNLGALLLRILFTWWQFFWASFETSAGKQTFLFVCESVIFIFYLNNVARVIASWILFRNQDEAGDFRLVAKVAKVNSQIATALIIYFLISVPMAVLTATITAKKLDAQTEDNYTWPAWVLLGLTCIYYVYQFVIAVKLSLMVSLAR